MEMKQDRVSYEGSNIWERAMEKYMEKRVKMNMTEVVV